MKDYHFDFVLEQAEDCEAQALMQRIVAWAEDNVLFVGGGYAEVSPQEAEDGQGTERE